jgi:hypothetical protein
MQLSKQKLNYKSTALKILELSKKYDYELISFINYSLNDFFNFVSNLEYKPDPKKTEFLSTPKYTLDHNFPYRDCDDKTLLICAFLNLHKLPKIILITGRNKPEHIFPSTVINKKRFYLDATYPNSKINELPRKSKIFDVFIDS